MKRLLLAIAVSLLTAGCVAVPVYDDGYYRPAYYDYYGYYGPYPYGYWGPDVVFIGHGGRDHDHGGFHGRGGFRDGGSFRGGGFRGGGSRGGGFGGRR